MKSLAEEFQERRNARFGGHEKSPEEKEYWERINQMRKLDDMPPISAVSLKRDTLFDIITKRGNYILKHTGKTFVIDDDNRPFIEMLLRYFRKEQKHFQKYDPDFSIHKGIMLRGNVGRGKSILLRLFADNLQAIDKVSFSSGYNSKRIISCSEIELHYSRAGAEAIEPYIDVLSTRPDYVFDDLGAERTSSVNYGNRLNVMETILMARYDAYIRRGVKTHITTNLMDGNQLEDLYGPRIRSRSREMFNVIDVSGPDRRQ